MRGKRQSIQGRTDEEVAAYDAADKEGLVKLDTLRGVGIIVRLRSMKCHLKSMNGLISNETLKDSEYEADNLSLTA